MRRALCVTNRLLFSRSLKSLDPGFRRGDVIFSSIMNEKSVLFRDRTDPYLTGFSYTLLMRQVGVEFPILEVGHVTRYPNKSIWLDTAPVFFCFLGGLVG